MPLISRYGSTSLSTNYKTPEEEEEPVVTDKLAGTEYDTPPVTTSDDYSDALADKSSTGMTSKLPTSTTDYTGKLQAFYGDSASFNLDGGRGSIDLTPMSPADPDPDPNAIDLTPPGSEFPNAGTQYDADPVYQDPIKAWLDSIGATADDIVATSTPVTSKIGQTGRTSDPDDMLAGGKAAAEAGWIGDGAAATGNGLPDAAQLPDFMKDLDLGGRETEVNVTQGGPPGPTGEFLDAQSEAWLRSLFDPIDTQAQIEQAEKRSQEARARAQLDLDARAGMGGLGLTGGQIAMGADLSRQAAMDLTDKILGIQSAARAEELRRGTVASDFLDRSIGRRIDSEQAAADELFNRSVLGALGFKFDENGNLITEGEPEAPTTGGPADAPIYDSEDGSELGGGGSQELTDAQVQQYLNTGGWLPPGTPPAAGMSYVGYTTDAMGNIVDLYRGPDGKKYVIPRS